MTFALPGSRLASRRVLAKEFIGGRASPRSLALGSKKKQKAEKTKVENRKQKTKKPKQKAENKKQKQEIFTFHFPNLCFSLLEFHLSAFPILAFAL
jgi:hypothetical protein